MKFTKGTNGGNGDPALPMPQPQQPPLETLVSNAAVKYCNAAADHLEQTIAFIKTKTETFYHDTQTTADNLRQIGELEKARCANFYSTIKGAMDAVEDAKRAFQTYMQNPTGVLEAVSAVMPAPKELPAEEEHPQDAV
jgi:hypothetical protein